MFGAAFENLRFAQVDASMMFVVLWLTMFAAIGLTSR